MNRIFTLRFSLLLLLVSASALTSCRRDFIGVRGTGPSATESRTPGTFSGVQASIDANVMLHYDAICHVSVSGQTNILAVLTTEVHGTTLEIGFSRNVINHDGLIIHIYAPQYTSASLSGSGNITNTDGVLTGNFSATLSGSGNIALPGMQAGVVHATISGSGNISLSGQGQSLITNTSGSGNISAFDLPVQTCTVKISGSGNAEVNVSQNLDVDISGSGDVYYKGNPAVNANISGSGQLHHIN
jgi:hypothetical protein